VGTEFAPEPTSVEKNDLLIKKKTRKSSDALSDFFFFLYNVSEQSLNLCIRPTFNDPFVAKKGIENEEKGRGAPRLNTTHRARPFSLVVPQGAPEGVSRVRLSTFNPGVSKECQRTNLATKQCAYTHSAIVCTKNYTHSRAVCVQMLVAKKSCFLLMLSWFAVSSRTCESEAARTHVARPLSRSARGYTLSINSKG